MSTELTTSQLPQTPSAQYASGEILTTTETTLSTLERASIDMQIATAHAYPRSMARFKQRAIEIATIDEETARSCIYRREVGTDRNGQVEYAEGMSVRMAEIVSTCYGNLRVGARIVSQTERQVVAQGVAHDRESNLLCTSEVIESTVTKNGKPYSERMRITVAKAALAKARRDAIFQVVPKALARPVEAAVRKLLFGQSFSMSQWRERIKQWVSRLPIDAKRVWHALGVDGVEDLGQELIEQLVGIKTALAEGDMSLDDAFPEITTEDEKPKTASAKLENLKSKKKAEQANASRQPAAVPASEGKATAQPSAYDVAAQRISAAKSIVELEEVWSSIQHSGLDDGALVELFEIKTQKKEALK